MREKADLLIIEDDVHLLAALDLYLTSAGYQVTKASNGREGLQKLYAQKPDLVVLDIMMPGMDGWEVCSRIRELCHVPIVILTALGQEAEKVRGLQLGADDYVTKPFSLRELEARIESLLRRAHLSPAVQEHLLHVDQELVIDRERREVTRLGMPVELTGIERRLLFLLVENRGRILPISTILEQIWGHEYADEEDYVKLYIWRLRQKIEPDPSNPRYILTERGIGYRFSPKT